MGTNKLGQEEKTSSYQNHLIQQPTLYQAWWSLRSTIQVLQLSSKLSNWYQSTERNSWQRSIRVGSFLKERAHQCYWKIQQLFNSQSKQIILETHQENSQEKKSIIKLIDITNACIDLDHWLSHFKVSAIIIIPKPNKMLYDSTKSFCSIVLLNTTSKLFEKMIGEQLQFLSISNNFIYMCQLGRLKHRFITDASIALTHFVQSGWVKNVSTSMLAFDIT